MRATAQEWDFREINLPLYSVIKCLDWSPDGEQVAFYGRINYNWGIYFVDAGGGDATLISGSIYPDLNPLFISWAPDGSQIYFSENIGSGIYAVDAQGGPPYIVIGDSTNFQPYQPTCLSDGSGLIFTNNRYADIMMFSFSDSSSVFLQDGRYPDINGGIRYAFLYYDSNTGDHFIATNSIYGGELNLITPWEIGGFPTPAISEDGSQVVYEQMGPSLPELFVINIDGDSSSLLTDNGLGPKFSPTTNDIAFIVGDAELWIASPRAAGMHQSEVLPHNFSLKQNYPNPFNSHTDIDFNLQRSGEVKLSVYDILGRQVQILTRGYKEAGSYKFDFNASSYSSGVYFYSLESAGEIVTKKMILLK